MQLFVKVIFVLNIAYITGSHLLRNDQEDTDIDRRRSIEDRGDNFNQRESLRHHISENGHNAVPSHHNSNLGSSRSLQHRSPSTGGGDNESASPPSRPNTTQVMKKKGSKEDRMRMRDKCNCEELKHIECVLETKDLWDKFHDLETEMIITKTGRYVMQVCNFFF